MRYFTRGWANGELDGDEEAQTQASYAQRLAAISPHLPTDVRTLAELNLHDARIEHVIWEPALTRLQLSLVTVQSTGYRALTITYSGVLLGDQRIHALRDVARDRETQILQSEVDRDEDVVFSHRLLFWPRDELTIDFTDLSLDVADRADQRVNLGGYFIELDRA